MCRIRAVVIGGNDKKLLINRFLEIPQMNSMLKIAAIAIVAVAVAKRVPVLNTLV